MSAVRITLRAPREEVTHWLSMAGFSVLLHVTIFAGVLFVPQFFRSPVRFPDVYTVDLVALPAGAPGPPAEGPRTAAAAPAPAPAPARPEPAVKIPEKPEAKIPKAKPPRKPEPTKPKIEKAEPKPQASPSPEASAPSPEGGAGAVAEGTAATPGPPGGAGGIPGGAGGGGGSGFLDDATFAYGWYLSNMTSILGRNWARPIRPDMDRTLRAVVHFRVLKDGTLADIVLEQPSGDQALDRSALRAVQDSNPLPPLPYQYGKDSLGVHFFFDLKPD